MKYYLLIIGLVGLVINLAAQQQETKLLEVVELIRLDSLKVERMRTEFDGFLPADLRGDVDFLYQTLEGYIHKDKPLTAGITAAEKLSIKEQRQLKKVYYNLKNIAHSFEQVEKLLEEADDLLLRLKQKQLTSIKNYQEVSGQNLKLIEKKFDQEYKAILKNTRRMWDKVILYLWNLKKFKNDDAPNLLTELLIKHKEKIKLGFEFLLEEKKYNEIIDSLSQVEAQLTVDAETLRNENQVLKEETNFLLQRTKQLSTSQSKIKEEYEKLKVLAKALNIQKYRLQNEINDAEDSLNIHQAILVDLRAEAYKQDAIIKRQQGLIAEQNTRVNQQDHTIKHQDKVIAQKDAAINKQAKRFINLIATLVFALTTLLFATLFFLKKNQADTYLKELNHRVKNTLQDISALLSLQSKEVKDREAKGVLREAINRIEAIKIVYQHLYTRKQKRLTTINLKYYVEDLVKHLMSINANMYGNAQAYRNIEDVHVDMETGYSIGLIINELMTNSFKHAFEEIDQPKLMIGLSVDEKQMNLRVQDNGRGLPQNFSFQKPSSFGLKLVKDLVEEHKGRLISITNPQGGTAIEITFPFT